jgi:hypothetical protein
MMIIYFCPIMYTVHIWWRISCLQFWVSLESCSWTFWRFESHISNQEYQHWWKTFLLHICISHILLCLWHKVFTWCFSFCFSFSFEYLVSFMNCFILYFSIT